MQSSLTEQICNCFSINYYVVGNWDISNCRKCKVFTIKLFVTKKYCNLVCGVTESLLWQKGERRCVYFNGSENDFKLNNMDTRNASSFLILDYVPETSFSSSLGGTCLYFIFPRHHNSFQSLKQIILNSLSYTLYDLSLTFFHPV